MRSRLGGLLLLPLLAVLPVRAQECPWLPESRIDAAFPAMAPWSVFAGGEGRCKFVSGGRSVNNFLTLTRMVKASAREAEAYVRSVRDPMSTSYRLADAAALGPAGFAARARDETAGGQLILMGHHGNVVVMAQLSFRERVTDAEESAAVALSKEGFSLAHDRAAQEKVATCPYLDPDAVRKLLGPEARVQSYGDTSCLAEAGERRLLVSAVAVDDPVARLASTAGAGCRSEAVAALGPGAALVWGCADGAPRASVSFAAGGKAVELSFVPGREPTADERARLVELARLASARSAPR